MTCDFTSLSTVVHLYQDDGWDVANEGCVQWNTEHCLWLRRFLLEPG